MWIFAFSAGLALQNFLCCETLKSDHLLGLSLSCFFIAKFTNRHFIISLQYLFFNLFFLLYFRLQMMIKRFNLHLYFKDSCIYIHIILFLHIQIHMYLKLMIKQFKVCLIITSTVLYTHIKKSVLDTLFGRQFKTPQPFILDTPTDEK